MTFSYFHDIIMDIKDLPYSLLLAMLPSQSSDSLNSVLDIVPEVWQWLCFGLGILSLASIVLSFLVFPGFGLIGLISGITSLILSRWRRHRKQEKNWKTTVGFWASLPALLIFTITLGLVLFF